MHGNASYGQMLFFVEACESGSVFDGLLSDRLNIFVETGASPFESAYACEYSYSVWAYLSDCYSYHWMYNTEHGDIETETVGEQYELVKKATSTSTVCTYGDVSIRNETLISFLGKRGQGKVNQSEGSKPINSRMVYEDYLSKRIERSKDISEKNHFIAQLNSYQQKKILTDHIFQTLSTVLNLKLDQSEGNDRCHATQKADPLCVKHHVQLYEKHCGPFDEYSIKYASFFRDSCLANASLSSLEYHLKLLCKSM